MCCSPGAPAHECLDRESTQQRGTDLMLFAQNSLAVAFSTFSRYNGQLKRSKEAHTPWGGLRKLILTPLFPLLTSIKRVGENSDGKKEIAGWARKGLYFATLYKYFPLTLLRHGVVKRETKFSVSKYVGRVHKLNSIVDEYLIFLLSAFSREL